MYRTGKWLIRLRNRFGYKAVFQKKIYTSRLGPYDHHDYFKMDVMRGVHETSFDPQKVEIHLSHHKITPTLRFGINHPVCWVYRQGEYTMITKDEMLYTPSTQWSDELCYFLFFLCIQELSTRVYNYKLYYKKTKKHNNSHYKAIIRTLFMLRIVVNEAKSRNLYY
jgi:hypothetical protein